MDEYIKKNALYEKIAQLEELARNRYLVTPSNSPCYSRYMAQLDERTYFKHIIADFPAADVVPVRHGRWEWFEEWSQSTPDHSAECDDCGWRCSECKTALEDIVSNYFDDPYDVPQINYCPNCGADMRKGKSE